MSTIPRSFIEKRKNSYRVRVRIDGNRIDLGSSNTLEDAENIQALANGDLIVGKDPRWRRDGLMSARPKVRTMDELLTASMRRQKSNSGVKTYRATIKRSGGIGAVRADDLSAGEVQEWIDELAEELSLNTVRKYVRNCGMAWQGAMLDTPNPFRHDSLKVWSAQGNPEKRDVPNYEQFLQIVAELDDFYAPVARFQELTGLRRMEIGHLKCSDIDWSERNLSVRISKGETGGVRVIPLCDEAFDLCQEIVTKSCRLSDRALFPGYHPHTYNKALVAACERIGVPRTTSHRIRHRAISVWLKAVGDIMTVAQVAGHAKPSMTSDVYGHAMPNEPQARMKMIRESFQRG